LNHGLQLSELFLMGSEERLSIFQLGAQLLVFFFDRFPLVFGGCDHLIRFFKERGC
jgi:hypothetical protein